MSDLHDDPILTAYALGELAPAEALRVERLLARDPAARAALDEIRTACGLLESALRPGTTRTSRRWPLGLAAAACVAAALTIAAIFWPQRPATVARSTPPVAPPPVVVAGPREDILPNPFLVRVSFPGDAESPTEAHRPVAFPPVRLQLSLSYPEIDETQTVGKLFAFDPG